MDSIDKVFSLFQVLLGALITALLTIRVYFLQREYEQVRKRYLEDGIDTIVRYIETSLHIFQYNWTQAIMILKTFRGAGKDTPKGVYSDRFMRPDPNAMSSTRHYVLQQLVRDSIFYKASQLLMVFLHDTTNTFENDLCTAVSLYVEGGKELHVPDDRVKIVEPYLQKLKEIDKEAQKYWILLGHLQTLSLIMERSNFTFRSISRFYRKPEVKKVINLLRDKFKTELERLGQNKQI